MLNHSQVGWVSVSYCFPGRSEVPAFAEIFIRAYKRLSFKHKQLTYLTLCYGPIMFPSKVLTPNGWYLEVRSLGIKFRWGHEDGALIMGLVSLREEKDTQESPLSQRTFEHILRRYLSTSQESGTCHEPNLPELDLGRSNLYSCEK